jgi:hypothetical protein
VPSTLHTIPQRYTGKMSRARTSKYENGANLVYKVQLWQMDDALRDSMDAAKFKHITAEPSRRRPLVDRHVVETHADERWSNGICL